MIKWATNTTILVNCITVKKKRRLTASAFTTQPYIRHTGKQSGLCGATLLSAYLAVESYHACGCVTGMSYLAARVPHPLQHAYPAKCPKYSSLHCLPQKQALDGCALSKVEKGGQRDNGKKKKANSPSRTGNHANGTPLKKPPPVVRDSNEGSSPVTVARHGFLIF